MVSRRTATRPADTAPARTWSTLSAPEHEQLAVWREIVAEAFVPVSIERDGDGPFPSTVRSRDVGTLRLAHVVSAPHRVARTAAMIERRDGHAFYLNLPLSPGASAMQGGRLAELAAGDLVLIDSTQPFTLAFAEPFEQLSLSVPRETLAATLPAPDDVTAIRIPGDRGVGAVAAGAVIALAGSVATIDLDAGQALAQQLIGLIALALAGVRADGTSSRPKLLLQEARAEVERSLGDCELTPAVVAERVGVSTRYLHRLFSESGPSFRRWLQLRRLERARLALVDPLRAHWSIADVARHHGFRDQSHFSRTFRAQFGMTPRECRRQG